MFKKHLTSAAVAAAFLTSLPSVMAEPITQAGQAEVNLKAFKDRPTANLDAKKKAEIDAIRAVLRLKLNVDFTSSKAQEAIAELVKTLGANMKTVYALDGDTLTARTTLNVDSAELTDLARSLGLQNMNMMEAAAITFMIDEYWGIATSLDPSKPLVSEVEFFQDKSSASSGSNFSDTSSKSAQSSSLQGSINASSKESAAMTSSDRVAVAGSQSSAFAASDRRAIAVQDGAGGGAAAARRTDVVGAQESSFAGAAESNRAAARSSDTRLAATVNTSSSSAADNKNVQASSFNTQQKDVTSFKSKSVFPDVNNAKPSDAASALIAARLAQIAQQYGLAYSPEGDLRETGKGKMLITDIMTQQRVNFYKEKAAKDLKVKYVVFGSSVMNAEGKSSSGRTICSGMLKLESYSVDTGRGLVSGTLVKRAEGSSDQDCRSNLSTALATELAQTVGNAATRELQLLAQNGQAFTVTLYSKDRITRGIGGAFEDALRGLVGELREQSRDEATRVYTLSLKGGDLPRRIEKLLDSLGAEMKNAEVQSKGNRVVVCVEGRCPTTY